MIRKGICLLVDLPVNEENNYWNRDVRGSWGVYALPSRRQAKVREK
jgi:hypothetical protein